MTHKRKSRELKVFSPFSPLFFWKEREEKKKKAHKQEKQSVVLAGKGGACKPNGETAWWLILLGALFNIAMHQQKPQLSHGTTWRKKKTLHTTHKYEILSQIATML